MDLAALTILFFGVLIAASGMTGLARPEILLHILGLSGGRSAQVFVMASAQASLAMGLCYILAAVNDNRMFIRWSVPLRSLNFAVFAGMVLLRFVPVPWLLIAGLELSGALVTGIALSSNLNLSWDRFNTLRLTSVTLAFIGALVVLQTLGIYGSASVFLIVSTGGFIYAYRMFAQRQA